jgi:hypothetical protein
MVCVDCMYVVNLSLVWIKRFQKNADGHTRVFKYTSENTSRISTSPHFLQQQNTHKNKPTHTHWGGKGIEYRFSPLLVATNQKILRIVISRTTSTGPAQGSMAFLFVIVDFRYNNLSLSLVVQYWITNLYP